MIIISIGQSSAMSYKIPLLGYLISGCL